VKILVFAGPTLAARAIRAIVDADVMGPARFGDVYRAVMQGRDAIAIIDGYFERVPAVWHKEILWAMSEGVHVFGASSMGALRAAELASFGMVGIGAIFEAYRDGVLEDDDEVAVAHAPAEDEFRLLSEAMVNIRATLRAATHATVIAQATETALLDLAKRQFYAERSYPAMLAQAAATGLDARELGAFREWLDHGKVDQKQKDAIALLTHLRDWAAGDPPRKQVAFHFEPTDSWHEATQMALAEAVSDLGPTPALEALLEEELKLAGAYEAAIDGSAARGLALELAMRVGARPDAASVQSACSEFRFRRGLQDRDDFQRWREAQKLEDEESRRFFETEARLSWARPIKEGIARSHLADHLRATGQYGHWLQKVEDKTGKLRDAGLVTPSLADVGMTESELWRWYFGSCRACEMPRDLDGFAVSCGFREGKDQLRAAVLREAYVRRGRPSDASG
jgi:hypothetical protein